MTDRQTLAEHRERIEARKKKAAKEIAETVRQLMNDIETDVESITVETIAHRGPHGEIDERVVLGVDIKTARLL